MKCLIILLLTFTLISFPSEKKEYIAIVHIGPSNKPIYPTIISIDSIGDSALVTDFTGKPKEYFNARNYLIKEELYNKLKKVIINYKINEEKVEGEELQKSDFIIFVNGNCKTHKYFI